MRPPRTEYERENRRGLLIGGVLALILGLTVYPPIVLGGGIGACLGAELSRRRGDGDHRVLTTGALLVAGVVLAVGLALGEVLGLAEERSAFLRAWAGDGALHLAPAALAQHPWAWLPQTAAIAALTAVVASKVVRSR